MVENLIPRPQLRSIRDQYRRKLAIFTKKMLFLISPANTSLGKIKCCKLMTKPRRYGGKSHPATPTQEQTRWISTETSNLDKKFAFSDICCVNGHCRNKTLQTDDQIRADMVENLIPRPQLRSRRDQWRRKLAIYRKKKLFVISFAKTSLEKTKVASWWPNRADMVENLIPRRQHRSKRDQYRRKLAI